jgi:hypothetical protein
MKMEVSSMTSLTEDKVIIKVVLPQQLLCIALQFQNNFIGKPNLGKYFKLQCTALNSTPYLTNPCLKIHVVHFELLFHFLSIVAFVIRV